MALSIAIIHRSKYQRTVRQAAFAMWRWSWYGSNTSSPSPMLYSCLHTSSQALATSGEKGRATLLLLTSEEKGLAMLLLLLLLLTSEVKVWMTNLATVCTGASSL